jgi:hypothetical protein
MGCDYQNVPYRSVAVADVNGDGKPDMVVANCMNNTVGVLLGNGDGTFQPAVTYNSGGEYTAAVAIADVNGDGKPDILVTNFNSGTVGVLLGNGDGTFQAAVAYGSGGSAADVAVADVNHDGKPDLIVANGTSGTVAVLLGNGDGTFQPPITYGAGGGPWSVAVADVNGDGIPDLLVADSWWGSTVAVLLGNGDGTFQPAVTYGSGGVMPWSIAVADVNGDNKLDLVVANCGTNPYYCFGFYSDGLVGVLLGNGDGTFQPAVSYDSGGYGAASVAIADLNGDGKPDLAVANLTFDTVGVLLGNGDGTFQPALTYGAGGFAPDSVVAADLNGDGKPDLVIGNWENAGRSGGEVGVLLHNGTPITLVPSLNPAAPRKLVTYTATATSQDGGAVTGMVTFQDGGSVIATVPLANNQAAYSTTYAKGGSHAITATYSGDAQNTPGVSATLVEYIESYASKTVVTTSGSPSLINQPVTFTATVTSKRGTIPDGELVTFYDGFNAIGTGTTTSSVATFTTSSLTAKMHIIRAAYGGDATFEPSTGLVRQVVDKYITKYTTTTALVSSLNPSVYGQPVTFTATVTSTGPNIPTGHVKFGGIGDATLNAGVATLTKTWLNAGTYAITAEYEGDSDSAPSASSVLNQVVNPASTITAITSSANPSSPGQSVTFTATVMSSTGANAIGTVTFTAGATTLGTVTLKGIIASISTAALPVGSTAITATYNGATDFTGSSASLTQTVNSSQNATLAHSVRATPSQGANCWTGTQLYSSGSPSLDTDTVTFTAPVVMSIYCRYNQTSCGGAQVVFFDRRTVLGTAPVNNNSCVANLSVYLTAGSHPITAILQPPPGWHPSSAHFTQVVDKFPTTTTLTSSQNPSIYGQDVTLTATVTANTGLSPTRKVKFIDGATTLGFATLDANGVAILTKKFLPVGTNSITAKYLSDSFYAPSTSPVLNQVVNPASP